MPAARRVALATCAELPDLDEDGPALLAALALRGIQAAPVVWDDPAVDWSSFDLSVIRTTWDYPLRRAEFLAWADGVPRLRNAANVVRWNTDKRYLHDLADAGVPIVPTRFLDPGEAVTLPTGGEYVVKPAVGAGGRDTARYGGADAARALTHVSALHAVGRTVMVQPYLSKVADHGETSVVHIGGRFSHGARKAALLNGPGATVDDHYRREAISARGPQAVELAVAERVLRAAPGGPTGLLYARVDLLPGADGSPVLLELEVTEPSLFLGFAPGAVDRFADAITAAIGETLAVAPGRDRPLMDGSRPSAREQIG